MVLPNISKIDGQIHLTRGKFMCILMNVIVDVRCYLRVLIES